MSRGPEVGRRVARRARRRPASLLRSAFLLGVPLLFTMEDVVPGSWSALAAPGVPGRPTWWPTWRCRTSPASSTSKSAAFAGISTRRSTRLPSAPSSSAAALLALNRISLDDPLDSVLGKIIVQTALSTWAPRWQTRPRARGAGRQGDEQQSKRQSFWRVAAGDVGATAVGGLFIGVSIAPTDEIRMLAAQLTSAHLVALIALSLVITYIIVFESGFDRSVRRQAAGLSRMPIAETMMAYVVALLVALGSLFLFNQADLSDPIDYVLAQTLVLGGRRRSAAPPGGWSYEPARCRWHGWPGEARDAGRVEADGWPNDGRVDDARRQHRHRARPGRVRAISALRRAENSRR